MTLGSLQAASGLNACRDVGVVAGTSIWWLPLKNCLGTLALIGRAPDLGLLLN